MGPALKVFVLMLLRKYGWVIAAKIVGELCKADRIKFSFRAENEEQKAVFDVAALVISDGRINKVELIKFLRAFKPAIPGWLDDVVVEALVAMLEARDDFDYGTDEKPELFEALRDAIADHEFNNREFGVILLEFI